MKSKIAALGCLLSLLVLAPAHAQDFKERTIRVGHMLNKDHPISAGVQKFAELVEKGSGGKIRVREFANGQLGNELQQQAALQGGTQEMFNGATSTLAGLVKEYGLLDFPFIFGTEEHAAAVLDGPMGQQLFARLEPKGIVGLAYWETGFRNVTNSRHPINKVEDLRGLKIRVMSNPVYINVFKEVGSNPVPMSFGELFTALETKAVDAQENPLSIILSNNFYEVQKYLTTTRHTYLSQPLIASKKFMDSLSPAENKLIRESALAARDHERAVSRASNQKAIEELRGKGMQVNDFNPAERTKMRAALKPVTEKFAAEYDPAFVKAFMADVDQRAR